MLPTFVIGLREGLEAALIVGIIAAFLRKQGRTDLLRWVFVGVGTAILLCLGVGIALEVVSKNLPQRQQEGLETVVGALAVVMVTYMVVWMRRHSRELKGTLEGAAAAALADGSDRAGRALVVMAFLAVLREGFETVVFLLAAFNETGNGAPAVAGAVLGIAVAVVLGWGIYRGGVRLNLSKFFRATGLVLVLVAAGLVLTALHTAHEAGWLNSGQGATVDLTSMVRPGSVQASLLTGMLGVQPRPVLIEVVGWLAYLVPVGLYVAWPPGRAVAPRRVAVAAGLIGTLAAVMALVVSVTAPATPSLRPVTTGGTLSAHVASHQGATLVVRGVGLSSASGPASSLALRRVGVGTVHGLSVDRYQLTRAEPSPQLPSTISIAKIASLNGGRLPLGLASQGTRSATRIPVTYSASASVTVLVEARTLRIVSATVSRDVTATVRATVGAIPLGTPVARQSTALPPSVIAIAVGAARHDLVQLNRRHDRHQIAIALGVLAAVLLAIGAGSAELARRRRTPKIDIGTPHLIGHQVSLT